MKGIVFLGGGLMVMRFLNSGAFAELEQRHELIYAISRSEDDMEARLAEAGAADCLRGRRIVWLPHYPTRFERWRELFDISCILYKDKSPSFMVRYQEALKKAGARLERFARPEAYQRHRDAVENAMGLHPEMLALAQRERPDFFAFPSAGLDFITDDVLQLSRVLNIPALLLVYNWDNLSSKGLMYHLPRMIGVWGEQSKHHAVDIQGFQPDDVAVIGAAQYQGIGAITADRAALRREIGVPVDRKVVLFAGTLRLFDETQLLREVEAAIESGALPEAHILYRPHPWRQFRDDEASFFDFQWRHVTMDPAMVEAYQLAKAKPFGSVNVLYETDYLFRLYKTVDAVISPMSTVLLEGMIFGLPVMAVAFSDGKHSWSADKVSKMLHFKELYDIPELLVCRARDDFFSQFRQIIANTSQPHIGAALQQHSQYFAYQDTQTTYAGRVADLADTMLSRVSDKPQYAIVTPSFVWSNTLKHRWAANRTRRIIERWYWRARRVMRRSFMS